MTPLVEEKLVSYPRYTMTKWGEGRGSTLAPKERVSQLGKSLTDAL